MQFQDELKQVDKVRDEELPQQGRKWQEIEIERHVKQPEYSVDDCQDLA